ncbi:hypothetical protein C8046_06305 [Serinibacter arcticus]|uniref:General stress protein 17M-like domain-containing protein n=1 Tax=Serinibacter arcticus TaxID=1655435 RepID=A0A2U1ZTL2_9MICO|nr:general stress protein [Serinibacter arcticus]PWD50325.1 hypothetical protein C8046_06305 [Serinibacter arcticus]
MSLNDPRAMRVPTPPQGVEIASFATYLEAQKAVDVLADGAFTVQAVTIVGSDLKMVERVTGRLSYPRVALAGALSGVWFGIFVGLLFSLFAGAEGNILATILTCAAIGAAFGSMFGVISYSFTGGKRDFVSSSQVVASRYSVLCLPDLAAEARDRLRKAEISVSGGALGATQQQSFGQAQPPVGQPPVGQPQYGQQTPTGQPQYPAPAQAAPQPQQPAEPSPDEPPRYGQRIEGDRREP